MTDGKVEYGKVLDLGVVPSNASETYSLNISNLYRYTEIKGYTTGAWPVEIVPQKVDDTSIVYGIEGDDLRVTTYTSNYADANYKGYVELHYLKNQ